MRLRWFLLASLAAVPMLVACSGSQANHAHDHCHDGDCHAHGHDATHHPDAPGSASAVPAAPASAMPR
ncbi:MAG: hypothetical protein EOO75_10385 [Myxococcales bacterium]|nr:MAG: hypothetical protein EOO75_10385 [Myxococcales bacterium]